MMVVVMESVGAELETTLKNEMVRFSKNYHFSN